MYNTVFTVSCLCFTLLLAPQLAYTADWSTTPYATPSVPLAVRSPYLSAWLPQGAGAALNAVWPQFWTGSTLGWAGFINVDGTSYCFLGTPANVPAKFEQANQLSLQITPTRSTFLLAAGPVDLTVTFLSPVEPGDLLKQSIPFAYMSVSVVSTDSKSHAVQVYADISAEWVSRNDNEIVNWTTADSGDSIVHTTQLADQVPFAEYNDGIQQGVAVHATSNSGNVTYQTGEDIVVRAQFVNNSKLANTEDSRFRAISNDWPVFALAHDLGEVTNAPSTPAVFAVGHVRDPAVQYIVANNGIQDRSSYFWSNYSSAADVVSAFLDDYDSAFSRATALDQKISSAASAISSNYSGLVSLSLRQAYGAMEITVSQDSAGVYNTSDVMVFLKEISSDGNVNTVDVIFPTWPAVIYTDPAIGKYLLEPLLAYQATGKYPNQWAVHDLGAHYPNATGYNSGNDENMPIEESGNMLIMTLSYVQWTNDTSIISTYYNLLQQWTEYLISNTLTPADQLDTDDFQGALANQTNLAIKGIIAIKAMSKMSALVGDSSSSSNYASLASSYVQQWQTFGTASNGLHLTLQYGNDSSWVLAYNLFADRLLGTDLVPSLVFATQDTFYSSVSHPYGVPLDTRSTLTLSNWEIWAAACATSQDTRDMFINKVVGYITNGGSNLPYGDWYDTMTGKVDTSFRARPVVGGNFALLLANGIPSSSSGNSSSSSGGGGSSSSGGSSGTPSKTSSASRGSSSDTVSSFTVLVLMVLTFVAHL